MKKSKWLRLWILLSGILIVATSISSGYYVWGQASCYRIITISISQKPSTEDYALAKEFQGEDKTYCGNRVNSEILTLEELAKHGAVTQIGFQWLEPDGWSFDAHDALDIENGKEIQASKIIEDVNGNVHKARYYYATLWVTISILTSLVALAIGWGVGWVNRG